MFGFAMVLASSAQASQCELYFTSEHQFNNLIDKTPTLKDFTQVVNKSLKETFEFMHKIDTATLGLASAIASHGVSFESLKPVQWEQFAMVGYVLYQESPISGTPLRGARLTLSEGQQSRTIVTGTHGEFAEHFSKLISYQRLRLFPGPIFEMNETSVATIKVPLTITLESKFCSGKIVLSEVPFEPVILIASLRPENDQNKK